MYRFWYRFIPMRLTLIERGMSEMAWQGIEPKLNNFLGPAFAVFGECKWRNEKISQRCGMLFDRF